MRRLGGKGLGQLNVADLAAIPCLAAIAFGHPHRFNALAVGEGEQVADCAIGGVKLRLDLRSSDDVSSLV
jgi:hypothetical protein